MPRSLRNHAAITSSNLVHYRKVYFLFLTCVNTELSFGQWNRVVKSKVCVTKRQRRSTNISAGWSKNTSSVGPRDASHDKARGNALLYPGLGRRTGLCPARRGQGRQRRLHYRLVAPAAIPDGAVQYRSGHPQGPVRNIAGTVRLRQ